jgi:hypothetical protein
VDGVRGDRPAGGVEPAGEFGRELDVRELRAPVGAEGGVVRDRRDRVEVEARAAVCLRGGRDHARPGREVIEQLDGQQVRREVVDVEGVLDAEVGEFAAPEVAAGVVQEEIEFVEPVPGRAGEVADGVDVGEVRGHERGVGAGRPELRGDGLALRGVPAVNDHVRAEPAEGESRRSPDPAGRPGDQRRRPREVPVGDACARFRWSCHRIRLGTGG